MSEIRLHIPDEPAVLADRWLEQVTEGREDLGKVLVGHDGLAAWLWRRWQSLSTFGVTEADVEAMMLAYRRELWLWLVGERTWTQACSGLLGRIERRIPAPALVS